MEHLPQFKIDLLKQWLAEQGVPDYCANRLFLFLSHHEAERYEESTYLGVPLIDEITLYLYKGKSFTTKRGNRKSKDQSKPELAIKSPGAPELEDFCNAFVQAFGSLQENPDYTKLASEDYWNRHAIVHGLMRRPMGRKDSAKCLMAIKFLIFAKKEGEGERASDDE
jgi:hypothetical protein